MRFTTLLLPLVAFLTSTALATDADADASAAPSSSEEPPTDLPHLDIQVTSDQRLTCTRKTRAGDTISVHYKGSLASTGAVFDASHNRGVPITFQLGAGRVIRGWDQGLLDMCVGEKRTLTIPPELGYGDRATGPIPAGSTLIFETELMDIQGVKRDEL